MNPAHQQLISLIFFPSPPLTFCRSEDVLGPEGEALRWFLYPWEGGRAGSSSPSFGDNLSSGSAVANGVVSGSGSGSGGCIVNPKVYGGVTAVVDGPAAATVADATNRTERVVSKLNGAVSKDAAAAAATAQGKTGGSSSVGGGSVVVVSEDGKGVAESRVSTATASATAMATMVAFEAAAVGDEDRAGKATKEVGSHVKAGALVGAAVSATTRVGEAEMPRQSPTPHPPPPPSHPDDCSEQDKESSAAPSLDSSNKATAAAAQVRKTKKQPDDSHKYPLRQVNSGNGGGDGMAGGGGFLLSLEAPPFLASQAANTTTTTTVTTGSSSSSNGAGVAVVNGGGTDNGTGSGTDGVANGVDGGGGGGSGSSSGKLKGYEGHMTALGKLGAGSAESRLFPKPGKKLLKAVGQAVQVR